MTWFSAAHEYWPDRQLLILQDALKKPALSGSSSHFPGNIVTQCRYSISMSLLAIARDICRCPGSPARADSSAHSRFCIHGRQHKRVAGSHMKLTNESATAMSLPIPILTVVSLQQRRCEFKDHRAATAALGAAPLRAWFFGRSLSCAFVHLSLTPSVVCGHSELYMLSSYLLFYKYHICAVCSHCLVQLSAESQSNRVGFRSLLARAI